MKKICLILLFLSCFFNVNASLDTVGVKSVSDSLGKNSHEDAIDSVNSTVIVDEQAIHSNNEMKSDGKLFVEALDRALEPNIGATLAGLSLAALAFLYSLLSTQEIHEGQTYLKDGIGRSLETERKKTKSLKTAIINIKYSFYFFIGFLVETITIDNASELKDLLIFIPQIQAYEVLLSGGLLLSGLTLLVAGANKIVGDIGIPSIKNED